MSASDIVDETAVDPTKLIINYLPPSVTTARLTELFAPYGTVEEANVIIDRATKMSRGFGFVKYSTEESAKRAVEAMDGKVLEGMAPEAKPLHVAVSKPPKVEVNLYIGNLLNTVKQEDLFNEFSRFGTVVDCNIPLDRTTGLHKGFGFVKLDSKAAARKAIDTLGGTVVESLSGTRILTVKRAENNTPAHRGPRFTPDRRRYASPRMMAPFPPQPVTFEGICIFIYNIPPHMNEQGLQELFQQYGTVTGARVMRNFNQTSKGFGFVNMSTMEEANKAIAALNGRTLIPDRPLQVSLKRQ